MGRLDGKVSIVAEGTSGIGQLTAERFVEEGARVVIAGRRADEGERLAKRLGPHAHFIRTDVTREEDIKAMIARAVEDLGRLDCLFNNAGGGTAAARTHGGQGEGGLRSTPADPAVRTARRHRARGRVPGE
jgi:NAD(P)-dependent dehydrogenase (short-subunit alcohol dehydrogenase family)